MDQRRTIQENEWQIFDKYARRVCYIARQFSSTSDGPRDIDLSIFRTLQNLKGQPLFFRLRILSIPVSDIANTHSSCHNAANVQKCVANLAPFILATLTRVNVLGHRHGNCSLNHAIVDAISTSSPQLRHFRIEDALDAQIIGVLPKFQHIKMFDFGFDPTQPYHRLHFDLAHTQDVYAAVFSMASSLGTLSTLLINSENAIQATFSSPSFPPILNLSRLAIKIRRCSIVTHLLPLIPNLTTISILAAELHLDDMKELGSALSSCPLLRKLEISAYRAPMSATVVPIVEFVRPLKGLPLEALILETFLSQEFEVSCGAIWEIGRAFPKLRKLYLFSKSYSFKSPFSHVDAGISIARVCPDLVDFKISRSLGPGPARQPAPLAPFPTETTFHMIQPASS